MSVWTQFGPGGRQKASKKLETISSRESTRATFRAIVHQLSSAFPLQIARREGRYRLRGIPHMMDALIEPCRHSGIELGGPRCVFWNIASYLAAQ